MTTPRKVKRVRRIALVLGRESFHASVHFYYFIFRGIARFAWERNWMLIGGRNAPDYVKMAGLDAVIGQFPDEARLDEYRSLEVPVVQVLGDRQLHPTVPAVLVEHLHCGRLAGEHLLDRGFRDFGYYGYGDGNSDRRLLGFRESLQGKANSLSVCPVPHSDSLLTSAQSVKWLRALPKPVGVLAGHDDAGVGLLTLCHTNGIRVPSDVAVVGVNDDAICTVSRPELSSVTIPWDALGYRAAEYAAQLLDENEIPQPISRIAPVGLTQRGSSDVSALSDPEVSEAAAFIRAHFHEPIGVADILDAVPIGRRPLELRFKAMIGRTLLEEIHHVRLDRATRLLVEGNMRISDVAKRSGFGTRSQFYRVFREARGMTPHEYRQRFGNRQAEGY